MQYVSTRNNKLRVSASEAILQGLAPDGGLFVPESIPTLRGDDIKRLCTLDYAQRAAEVMSLYLPDFTKEELLRFAGLAYSKERFPSSSPAPLRTIGEDCFLELWHGPTCAFKDMALQMLPYLLTASLEKSGQDKNTLILTATSGDTGKAALEGFRDVERTKIMVFYPADGVSDVQALQMNTQKGGNVCVQAVVGNFDDTQTGVKAIFSDVQLIHAVEEAGWKFSSANSINWGRLLPQIVYYVSAYCDLLARGEANEEEGVNFCVPTGNFGNILSAYYAKEMGVPIKKLICASNSNNVLTDFIQSGSYDRNREFRCTISPSMDILISSNLERLLYQLSGRSDETVVQYMSELSTKGAYTVSETISSAVKELLWAGWSDETQTKTAIRKTWDAHRYLIDPHTAVAADVKAKYTAATGDRTPTVIVSTANPYKFGAAVLAALGAEMQSDTDPISGTAMIDLLHDKTGRPVPDPIAALKTAEVRFGGNIKKEDMAKRVIQFI